MGMFGNLGVCKDCKKGMVALQNGRCDRCHKFKQRIDQGVKTINQHPDLQQLDALLNEWYA